MSSRLPRRREVLSPFGAAREAPASARWLHVSRHAMGCEFVLTVPHEDGQPVSALRAGLDEVDALDARLSIYRPTSEVSQVNARAFERAVTISDVLADLLAMALELADETEGAFDPVVGGRQHVALDRANRSLRFLAPEVALDFGAIGKGFALDRAAAALRARGVERALLTAGTSSVRALGAGPDGGFRVAITDPRGDEGARAAEVTLVDAGLGTSGVEFQGAHILDRRSGAPATSCSRASVVAATAACADALSTAVFVGGPALAERLCANRPDLRVLLLMNGDDRPRVVTSRLSNT